ncbi:MAG: hypothetical protein GXO47_02020 [Chlorobi bacterium]|nr:hypothetical protein [Chlorobiota bacterium]
MKNPVTIFFILYFILSNVSAQDKVSSVEKSIWGIQIGLPPVAVYNEFMLADEFSLRSELSLGFAWQSGTETVWAVSPVIQIEPRYYYNIKRRVGKGKRIDGNSGNYLSFIIGGETGEGIKSKDVELYPGIFLLPMYGLKRNVGNSFNYEFALGVGYAWSFQKYTDFFTGEDFNVTIGGIVLGIRIAIGYKF